MQWQSVATAANAGGIKLEPVKSFYFVGNPIKVFLVTQNTEKQDGFLGMNFFGLPGGRARLISPKGEVLEPKGRDQYSIGVEGPPLPLPRSELYPFKSGEAVQLCYDLNELFAPKQAGKYKFELVHANEVLAGTEVNLIANEIVSKSEFRGYCRAFFTLSANPIGAAYAIIEGHLVVSKAVVQGKDVWLLNVEGNKLAQHEPSNFFEPLNVLPDTTVQNSAVDFKGQLWIVLESGTKKSLVIWNQATGSVQTVIPWQTANIEMGNTPLSDGATQPRIVIAGIAGKTKISSLSYGVTAQPK